MSFETDYINLLDHCLDVPSIQTSNDANLTIVDSLLTKLTGINWFKLYNSKGDEPNISLDQFQQTYKEHFYNDPLVKSHIDSIIDNELNSKVLNPHYTTQRRTQLFSWFHDYYYNELFKISNITTRTISNHRNWLKLAYTTFGYILPRIFQDGIWIHKQSFNNFKQNISKLDLTKANVLLLPNHKSHIDYIILHFLYVRFNLETPTVIAGDNLNVYIFGPILKKLGAIFIKRKFNTHKDFYYVSNMEFLMNLKSTEGLTNGIELFIEGTRSRNGKLMHLKTGFLKLLLNTSNDLKFYGQPISLIYEKPFEFDEMLIELNGYDKRQESFKDIFKTGLNLLFGHDISKYSFGKLIINFDQSLIKFDDVSVDNFGQLVLQRIHKVSHITEISILGLSIMIELYRDTSIKALDKNEVLKVFKSLTRKLIEKSKVYGFYIGNLQRLQKSSDSQLNIIFDSLIEKFLQGIVSIDDDKLLVLDELPLVYYKNNLLNYFLDEIFQSKSFGSLQTRDLLLKFFNFEFITSLINDDHDDNDTKLFQDLLSPFLESYELVLLNLSGIISIDLKNWLHLLYYSNPTMLLIYKESLNKSNLLNALYMFQSLKLLKINKQNEIIVLNEFLIKKLHKYLHDIRLNKSDSLKGLERDYITPMFEIKSNL